MANPLRMVPITILEWDDSSLYIPTPISKYTPNESQFLYSGSYFLPPKDRLVSSLKQGVTIIKMTRIGHKPTSHDLMANLSSNQRDGHSKNDNNNYDNNKMWSSIQEYIDY